MRIAKCHIGTDWILSGLVCPSWDWSPDIANAWVFYPYKEIRKRPGYSISKRVQNRSRQNHRGQRLDDRPWSASCPVKSSRRGAGVQKLICNVMEAAKDIKGMLYKLLWQGLPTYELHVNFNRWTLHFALKQSVTTQMTHVKAGRQSTLWMP
jgi:hypothetical protein